VIDYITHIKPNAQEVESWIAISKGEAIGHIYMRIENEMKIKFLDAWVRPEWRRKGVYRKLWETRWDYVNENYKGYTIYAWSKNESLPLLKEKGFNIGEICTYVEKII
jgi:predicted GNAT family acetyltransferase